MHALYQVSHHIIFKEAVPFKTDAVMCVGGSEEIGNSIKSSLMTNF